MLLLVYLRYNFSNLEANKLKSEIPGNLCEDSVSPCCGLFTDQIFWHSHFKMALKIKIMGAFLEKVFAKFL